MKSDWVLPTGVMLRLAEENDQAFLWALFGSARPELASLPLPAEQLTQLMRQQFEAQQHSYREQHPQLEHWIIVKQFEPVGKIMFESLQSAVHIIDFIIAPAWRSQGIGSTILTALKARAEAKANVLSLQVDRQNNNAKRLYHQFGFVVSQSSDTHEFLVWS
jgi:ribosomal protein S18 acetylase RimI-like enzyme